MLLVVSLAVLAATAIVALPATGAGAARPAPRSFTGTLPQLDNRSDLTDARVAGLAAEALGGLGFLPGAADGPQPNDRIFVGDDYVAWIDETGFYGKLNGLWWKACDPGALGYLDHEQPIEVTETAGSLRLVYETRLVKRADGTFPWKDSTGCHDDWLFPDGVRRPVYLRVGYELFAHQPRVDRLMQVRNPAGNPSFAGPFSFIGGFVITTWPDPLPAKAVNQFMNPETAAFGDFYLNRTMSAQTWNPGWTDPIGQDIAFGWLGQPFILSTQAGYTNGRSLRLAAVGPSDNLDTGLCLCQSHGGLEMGGGLLHSVPAKDAALPIAGGEISIEARRRLETAVATPIPDGAPWGIVPTTSSTSSTTSISTASTASTASTTSLPTASTTSTFGPRALGPPAIVAAAAAVPAAPTFAG